VTTTGLTATERRALAQIDPVALLSDLDTLVTARSLDGAESVAQQAASDLMRKHGLRTHEWQIDLAALHQHPSFSSEVERAEALGLVGEIGGAGKGRSLMFNAHIDVVPTGDESLWVHDPWRVTVAGGQAYGRGALDDKGGVVCAMHAARAIARAGIELDGRLLIASVVGEEDGGTGTLGTILAGHVADAAIVVEPTSLALVPAQAGALNFRVTVDGSAAHGCVRNEGVSAIEKFELLHAALLRLEAERNARVTDPLFARYALPIPLNIGTLRAGEWPSSVPERLVFEGRYGVAVGEDPNAARAELEEALAAVAKIDAWLADHPARGEWWGGQFDPASTPIDHPIVTTVSEALLDLTGSAPTVEGVTYGADMRLLTNVAHMPTVLFGPGDVTRAHRPDECVPVHEMVTATGALVLAALRFCGVKE
jgi:acetylornithine deacetylase